MNQECSVCSCIKFKHDLCVMCGWDISFHPKHTKQQAYEMLKSYWEFNGFEDIEERIDDFDIKNVMYGDYTRFKLDPHKYEYEE